MLLVDYVKIIFVKAILSKVMTPIMINVYVYSSPAVTVQV